MLKSYSSCENVVKLHAFSLETCAICYFSFEPLRIENEPVSNLKELLSACDRLSDYVGFEHLQQFITTGIVGGLAYLHSRNVAHRDLKPHNVLVTNRHYSNLTDSDEITYCWTNSPITAKLSDFGESRASLQQTVTVLNSKTHNLLRGSPGYMSPEALTGACVSADFDELKAMDIWSAGMTLFHLLNPSARHPFADKLDSHALVDQLKSLKKKILPTHSEKYRAMQLIITFLHHTRDFVNFQYY
jgi:serine/threonine protein kinase